MELKLDQWATTPPAGYPGIIPPPLAKRQAGWANGEEPPAGYFNHTWDALSDTQNELANLITGAGLAPSESSLSQVLAAVQVLIGRAQLKTALTTVSMIHDTGGPTLFALARGAVTPAGYKGLAIAVGVAGTIRANTTPSRGFTLQTPAFSYTDNFHDIAYDATLGLFIAVGRVGEIQTSNGDGTWTRRATGGSHFRKIASDGLGLCVAVGESELIQYSTNGTSWSTATSPLASSRKYVGLAFGAGVFVAVTENGDIITSPDGIAWTVRRNVDLASSSGNVVYDAALGFIFGGESNNDVFQSADGITWTQIHDSLVVNSNCLIASPYGWVVMRGYTAGTLAEARYSPTAVNHVADFAVDYVGNESLTWMKFIDGQLWALGGNKIYLGGVL